MKTTLTPRGEWYDYRVEYDGRLLYGTSSTLEGAINGLRKAEKAIQRKPLNPRREP